MKSDEQRQARVDEEQYGGLYDDYAGRYWHFTSWRGLQSIVASGSIQANVGQFQPSTLQTEPTQGIIPMQGEDPSRCSPTKGAFGWQNGWQIRKIPKESKRGAACKAVYAGSIPTLASNCHLPKVLEFRGFVLETCRCSGLSRSSQTGSNRLVPARLGGNATSQSAHKPLQTRGDHRRSLHSCINPFLWRCRCPFTSDPAARAVPSNCV
jgi:hypothetical protein